MSNQSADLEASTAISCDSQNATGMILYVKDYQKIAH